MSALGDRDAAARKAAPIARGVLWYFPQALMSTAITTPQPDPTGVLVRSLILLGGMTDYGERNQCTTRIARAALDILLGELEHVAPADPLPLSEFIAVYAPALAEVSVVSMQGAQQHCGGVLGWARGKSTDHADCIVRHFADRGTLDTDGMWHSAKVAWRALALLQTEIEAVAK